MVPKVSAVTKALSYICPRTCGASSAVFGRVRQSSGPEVGARWCLNWRRVWALSSRILITQSWLDSLTLSTDYLRQTYQRHSLNLRKSWLINLRQHVLREYILCWHCVLILIDDLCFHVNLKQPLRHKLFDLSETVTTGCFIVHFYCWKLINYCYCKTVHFLQKWR